MKAENLWPVDRNNLDGVYGGTAEAVDWPTGLSMKAQKALDYLDGSAFLFLYRGKYVITDEGGFLTNKRDDPRCGYPRDVLDSLEEIGPWLERTWDDVNAL